MRNRIIEIGESSARLRVSHRQLVIAAGERPEARIPLDDLGVLILSHPQISLTQPVLAELTEAGGSIVVCNGSRMPCGMVLPTAAHSTQTERMRAQIELPKPKCKRVWQQLVRGKIAAQVTILRQHTGQDHGLPKLARQVRSGDPSNVEAWAAKRYWNALFGSDFRRDRDLPGRNAMLNYGYAVLRAVVARAICAAGLHPSIGVHHHNRGNAFCLADDLMEPYRPIIDDAVVELIERVGEIDELSTEVRRELLVALTGTVLVEGQVRSLFDAVSRTASSLASIIQGESVEVILPDIAVGSSAKSKIAEVRDAAG